MTESMIVEPVVLTGAHVRLEPLTLDHVHALAEIGCDAEIWRYMRYGQMSSEDDMRAWVEKLLGLQEEGTDLPFVVQHLASKRIAGATRYMEIRSKHFALEIGGTWYGLDFQRTAVNTECKFLLLRHAFETLGAVRVQFKTDLRNERSRRALERIGAVREGILRNHLILDDGHRRASVYYSIIDSEWPSVKARLEQMLLR